MKNLFCNDIDGTILSVDDEVVVLDIEDLEGNIPNRGEILRVSELCDAESNYIEFTGLNGIYGMYGHRVLKVR